jgi:hypothetical protein
MSRGGSEDKVDYNSIPADLLGSPCTRLQFQGGGGERDCRTTGGLSHRIRSHR